MPESAMQALSNDSLTRASTKGSTTLSTLQCYPLGANTAKFVRITTPKQKDSFKVPDSP